MPRYYLALCRSPASIRDRNEWDVPLPTELAYFIIVHSTEKIILNLNIYHIYHIFNSTTYYYVINVINIDV